MCKILEKLNNNCRCVERYFEDFCRMIMRTGLVQDREENNMYFVEGLKFSLKRKANVEKMWLVEEAYQLALRI